MARKTGTESIRNTITERKGVCAIERMCCGINWLFRERGHSDYGIDADIEESILDNGVPKLTNRHIALQIKSGDSYFKFDTKAKKFYFDIPDTRIANYWLGSDRPVVLMACKFDAVKKNQNDSGHEDSDCQIYWAQIKPANIIDPTHRNAKKKRKGGKESKHIYGRVYLDKIFNKDSAKEFSDIISTYLPMYDTQLNTPSIILESDFFEDNSTKLFQMLDEEVNSLESAQNSLYRNCCLFDEGIEYTNSYVYYEIENNQLFQSYSRNIVNLLLTRYLETMAQLKEINYFDSIDLKSMRDEAINKLKVTIDKLVDLIKRYVTNMERDVIPNNDTHISILNQAKAVSNDYICMLEYHLGKLNDA